MRAITTTALAILTALAIGFIPVTMAATTAAANTVGLKCGATEIGVPKNCDEALPLLTNETTEKSVRFGFSIEPKNSSFSVVDNGCSAGLTGTDGQTCSVAIRFAPTKPENTADLTITQIVEGKPPTRYRGTTYHLTGQGTTPRLGISASSVQFGPQQTSTSSEPKGLTFTNNTEAAIEIKSIVAHGDFAIAELELPHTLQKKNDFLVLPVRFKPQALGYQSGFLEIMTDLDPPARYVTLGGESVVAACGTWSRCGIWTYCRNMRVGIALVLALLYWMLMVMERWNRIARPTRELLKAQIKSLQEEIPILLTVKTPADNAAATVTQLQKLLVEAENLLLGEKGKGDVRKVPWSTMLFWSRGEESTGWGYVHEVEVHMAALLDDATVGARLVTEEQKLRAAKDNGLTTLAEKIAAATADGSKVEPSVRRALLAEALNANYERGDTAFINMVSWQNKTSYLVVVGLALLVALAGVFSDQSILLLVGALGGFISRLSRTLQRNDVPTDYGASWTTLFLSPIAGALGAWAGVLLIDLAAKWQVVGSAVAVDWNNAGTDVPTLAIALLFGFSERLLDSVLDALEKKTLENKAAGAAGTSTPTKAPAPAPTPAPAPASNGSKQPSKGNDLPAAPIGQPYTGKLSATNAPAVPIWKLETGQVLPKDLVLATTGAITGTPAAEVPPGTYTFTAKAGPAPADPVYSFSIDVKAAG